MPNGRNNAGRGRARSNQSARPGGQRGSAGYAAGTYGPGWQYGPQPGYGPPPGYGPQQGYGPPPGYGPQQAYGPGAGAPYPPPGAYGGYAPYPPPPPPPEQELAMLREQADYLEQVLQDVNARMEELEQQIEES